MTEAVQLSLFPEVGEMAAKHQFAEHRRTRHPWFGTVRGHVIDVRSPTIDRLLGSGVPGPKGDVSVFV